MIVHLVLFRPHPHVDAAAREALSDAFGIAIREIPSVKRARVGRRITHGSRYEGLMRAQYPYVAVLEFDDLDGLKAYLHHPAHDRLASRFYETFEEALMYDFEMGEGAELPPQA